MDALKRVDALTAIIIVALVMLDGFVWDAIAWTATGADADTASAHDYFLDVGQGDSELVVFSGNVKAMTDAGPDAKVLDSLSTVMPRGDRYIDLAIISHPQADHFNGFAFILDHYDVGAFLYNGRDDAPGVKDWRTLKEKIAAKHIPLITLGAGDAIRAGNAEIDFLSPSPAFDQGAELNDTGLVELIESSGMRTLLAADIGFGVEDWLVQSGADIRADVLKVPHHGSKYSSSAAFLRAVDPDVVVIEVGAKNTYGHPSKEALARLASMAHAAVFRTDRNGTVAVHKKDGRLIVTKGK